MVRAFTLTVLIAMTVLLACSSQVKETEAPMSDLALLVTYMTGSFSSQEQAAADSNFYDIRLEMKPIWTIRSDAHWFYVEQAMAGSLDKPYRQRVYRISQIDDSTFESAVYTMEEPLRYAGAWKEEWPLADLKPDALTLREGCSAILRKVEDKFVGSTVGDGCESNYRGASYVISEVVISADHLMSWDRGFDADGNQVWGAEAGGYVFKKIPEAVSE